MMKINTKIKVVFCLLLTFLMISKISVNASSDNIETKQYLAFDSNAVYFYDDNRSLSEPPYTTSTVYTPNGSGVIPKFNNVNEVAMAVISDLEAMGRQGRIIESWDSDIQPNEYRIALRCGLTPYDYGLKGCSIKKLYDYHFMVQHSDGRWSEKYGTAGNSIVYGKNMNPSNISWDLGYKIGYYDSLIIYLAITR